MKCLIDNIFHLSAHAAVKICFFCVLILEVKFFPRTWYQGSILQNGFIEQQALVPERILSILVLVSVIIYFIISSMQIIIK